VDEWKASLEFTGGVTRRRTHLPDFLRVLEAVLEVENPPAELLLEFPRARKSFRVDGPRARIDVTDLIAPGRHTLSVLPLSPTVPEGYRATLRLTVRKPFVRTGDEAYIVDAPMMGYSQGHLLEDDRNAQRVGRFEAWLKTLPQDFHSSRVRERIDLSGPWAARAAHPRDITDHSVPWLDDSDWERVEVPRRLEGGALDTPGFIWLRKRVRVPGTWSGERVWLRFSGIDDQPLVYVNGCQAGYHCGWHRPFQFDVGAHLEPGGDNLIAIRLRIRKPHGIWHDGGITYTFVAEYALTRYPKKTETLGGIFGPVAELALLEHRGAVLFEPRFHPHPEGSIRILFAVDPSGSATLTPPDPGSGAVTFGEHSEFRYRPPLLDYRGLSGAGVSLDLRALAAPSDQLAVFQGHLPPGRSQPRVWAYIGLRPGVFAYPAASLVFRTNESAAPRLLPAESPALDPAFHWMALPIQPAPDGGFTLACAHADTSSSPSAARAAAIRAVRRGGVPAMLEQWEQTVYNCCRPLAMSAAEGAAVRSFKQSLTLVAKNLPSEVPGLFCDLIKYPIFWLRDAAVSIPGALYAGHVARAGAVATAGAVFSRATERIDTTRLNPDGSWTGGQVASDGPPLAVYAIYRVWCLEGDDWLRDYYPTVLAYMRHMDEVERRFGNTPDGIIRASDGDWWDYKYHKRYEREGSSGFVAVIYLRALEVAARMAGAMGDAEHARIWRERARSGRGRLCLPIRDGGLLMPSEGYLADTVMTVTDVHPNGWNYPNDLDRVTVFTGFRSLPHFIGIADSVITDPAVIDRVIGLADSADLIRPFPALSGYPWNDYMTEAGVAGEYEETEFADRWKALPGNHNAGGRWYFVGGAVIRGLWAASRVSASSGRAGEALAMEAKENLYRSMAVAHSPARVIEDAHASGLARHESGDPMDTEGFYYNWGAATPLEALVEGQYGVRPLPGGVIVDPWRCPVGGGIARVPVRGGEVGYRRAGERRVELHVTVDRPLEIRIPVPPGLTLTALRERGEPSPLRLEEADGHPAALLSCEAPGSRFYIMSSLNPA
jgi:hypothetical protein